ncbi:hypothetical protein EYF80_049540 [Liparis tanakae]|uniref:Uncharacterized protein n=1 Tax=Liparis tanakae TaxID=230148 RepID=A0A4Z2FHP6_9TELE|nr:hypothetical protein EYF80_049540 [Liparis tanakae]
MTATSLSAIRASASVTSASVSTAGPVRFFSQATMSSACLPAAAQQQNLMVGYPRTPYSWASSVSSVASTFPRRTSEPSAFSVPAALANSGPRALQWPHHGASAGGSRNNNDTFRL